MSSRAKAIGVAAVWAAVAVAALVSNSSTSVWLASGMWVMLTNVGYLVAGLMTTFVVVNAPRSERS